MQNVIKNEVYKDNRNSKNKLFKSCQGNINKIWKQAKNIFFKQKPNFPEKLEFNNTMYYRSKKVSNELNKFFINKIENKIKNIPKNKFDPIDHFKK